MSAAPLKGCLERQRLIAAAKAALDLIIDISLQQRRALEGGGAATWLDEDFGKAVGEKERAIGALCEHEREHGCI